MRWWQDWGFSLRGWKTNENGEYWLLAQASLLALFPLLPVYHPWSFPAGWLLFFNLLGGAIALSGLLVVLKSFRDLGANLTPLPRPKAGGELVQTGLYQWVRHPLYCGLLLLLGGVAIALCSLPHLGLTLVLLLVLNAKANREEAWLNQRFPDYAIYQQQVSKLLPGVF
jgi:protein-S-isoprenylcysteine O-methyltransferase Ste14